MAIFVENFVSAKVSHYSRTYLLTGKFLPRAKTYTHKKPPGLIIKTLTHHQLLHYAPHCCHHLSDI